MAGPLPSWLDLSAIQAELGSLGHAISEDALHSLLVDLGFASPSAAPSTSDFPADPLATLLEASVPE